MSSETNGSPPRIELPQSGRKPLLVVADDEGHPVMELPHYLAWHKATGTFYVVGSNPRAYLRTRDRHQAIFRFRDWVRRNGIDPNEAYIMLEHEPHRHPEIADPVHIHDTLNERMFVRYDMPSADFWQTVREVALGDPDTFKRETGLNVTDARPKSSVPLSKLLEAVNEFSLNV